MSLVEAEEVRAGEVGLLAEIDRKAAPRGVARDAAAVDAAADDGDVEGRSAHLASPLRSCSILCFAANLERNYTNESENSSES